MYSLAAILVVPNNIPICQKETKNPQLKALKLEWYFQLALYRVYLA